MKSYVELPGGLRIDWENTAKNSRDESVAASVSVIGQAVALAQERVAAVEAERDALAERHEFRVKQLNAQIAELNRCYLAAFNRGERLAAERDALAEQVASCRKAFGEIAKGIEDLDLEEIARFAGIPLEHLTGEEAGSDE